jgi:hypothetical protein
MKQSAKQPLSRRRLIGATFALAALSALNPVRAAEPPTAPATQPAYPALEQLNRETLSLTRDLQGSILRVQIPASRVAQGYDNNRWDRYGNRLNPDVKKALQQQQLRGNPQNYNNTLLNNSTSQPAYNSQRNGYVPPAPTRGNSQDQQSQQPSQHSQAVEPQRQSQGQINLTGNGNDPQQKELNARGQGLTIIVPSNGGNYSVGNNTADPAQAQNDQRAVGNRVASTALVPNNVGLLIDERKGYVLVPLYIERETLAEQPARLSIGDSEPIDALFVGSDLQTQLTVLQLLPAGAAKNEGNAKSPATQPARETKPQRSANEAIPGLGKPVQLASKPLTDGTLVVVFSGVDGAARLAVWNGPAKETGVVVGIDGQVAGIARGGQFLSGANCRLIAGQIIRYGSVKRATLGVIISQVDAADPDRQKHAELSDKPAVRVDEVMKGSVADKGGLRQGDLVMAVADEPVQDIPGLAAAIAARNGPTPLSVLRDGKVMTVTVELTQRD